MASILELGPRQRMINMMYIIFISMLAMNMSKEVLTAFGDVNSSLQTNIKQNGDRNTSLMAGLANKANEQPDKYRSLYEKAQEIQESGDNLVGYIDELKEDLQKNVNRTEDGELDYEAMDTDTEINEKFLTNDKLSDDANELKSRVDSFHDKAIELAEATNNSQLVKYINQKFSTEDVQGRDGGKQDWIRHNFEGFPLIAGITKLTNIQANAEQVQSDLLAGMLSGQMESDVSMTNYEAIVIPDKTAFFSGEDFTGKVVLGRFDNSLSFDKVKINGKEITNTKGGQVSLDFPAGAVGDQAIKGELQFKEGDSIIKIPVNSSYSVIPKPNSAVISADKMNVVYRGVSNPLTISIPGVDKVNASAPGMRHLKGSNYTINPTSIRSKELNIKVSGKLSNGETVSDNKKFRIKEIPHPTGTVRGQNDMNGPIRMQRGDLEISTVSAGIPDFDFDLKLNVSGFKIQVPGKPIIEVSGQKLNSAAKNALNAAKRGSTVQIFDIKASISGNASYKLPNIAPVTVQLTN